MSHRRPQRRAYRPRIDRLDDRWLPTAVGLTAGQLAAAYGLGAGSADGNGQIIAVVGAYHDPYLTSDVATFDQANGLYGSNATEVSGFVSQVDLSGGRTDDGWAGEAALDVESIRAVAPAAHIVVVEAKSANVSDLLAAVDVARAIPGVSVVSMSWGGSEFQGENALDSHFTTPAGHTPITFLAATGDTGAGTGAEWPASSPNVIAVGGTSLFINTSGAYQGEEGWSGGGGGYSAYESEPAYQLGAQTSGVRTTPDVSIVADPSTGLFAYSTTPSNGIGSWDATGGTSLSTQLWAGLIADADQARTLSGQSTLDTDTALTLLYSNQGSFHDVAWGYNGYWSTPGYDLVTGLGTPKAGSVVAALDPAPSVATAAATPTIVPAIAPVAPQPAHSKPPRHRPRHHHDVNTPDAGATPTAIDTTAPEAPAPIVPAPIVSAPAVAAPAGTGATTSAAATPTAMTAPALPTTPSPAVLQATGVANDLARPSSTAKAPTTPATVAKPAPSLPDNLNARKAEDSAPKAEGPAQAATPEAMPESKAIPQDEKAPGLENPNVEKSDGSTALDRYRIVPEAAVDPGDAVAGTTPMAPAAPSPRDAVAAEDSREAATLPAFGVAAFGLIASWRRDGRPFDPRRRVASPYRDVPAGPMGPRG